MISQRIVVRRIGIVALVAAMLGVTLAIPVIGATGYVSGTLTFKEQIGLSGNAVAVITIVDQAAAKDAGAIVGQERIDGVGQVPIPFSVPYDPSRIDPKHPYGLFATIIDGAKSWQNPHGIAVLTGGPTEGVDAILSAVPGPASLISGTITKSDTSALGPAAVAIAALIKQETGTLVNRQVLPLNGQVPVSFTVGFDPSVIDPAATYVVKAAIVDGSEVWENRDGVVAISGGTPATKLSVPVIKAPAPIPVSSPFPTARPTATSQPSVGPSVVPTPSPSGTARPSATATARPSGSPRPTPTGTPSPAPTASAGPTPTPTPSPSPTPSPTASLTPSPTPARRRPARRPRAPSRRRRRRLRIRPRRRQPAR